MRLLFLVFSLAFIREVAAQHLTPKGEFYVLVDSPSVKHATEIKNVSDNGITVKERGAKRSIQNANLAAFKYEVRYFQAFENFYLKPNNSNSLVKRAFAELLDSGQVSLFAYRYSRATIVPLLVSGTLFPGIGSSIQTVYLLRDASTQQVTTIPSDDLLTIKGGQAFRTALQPFLLKRPDLLIPLSANHLHIEDLADIIRALNSNKPFVRTNRTPFGVD
jgi:hypothetical protein